MGQGREVRVGCWWVGLEVADRRGLGYSTGATKGNWMGDQK